MTEVRQINFDMDGTIANLYGVEGWLEYLIDKDETPYIEAKPLVNLSALARVLNRLQRNGYELNIISWLAKNSDDVYDEKVILAKKNWLKKHMPSVKWNNVNIVTYGTPKQNLGQGILFDDEKPNRDNWNGTAYDVDNIVGTLKKLA
jgi:5'(3')-deoxyribonucleotidase